MANDIVSYSDMERMATTVAKSGLFGVKDKDQALALMALSAAEGVHPMIAVRDFHIINGRASLKADTMLARFQAAGGVVSWGVLTDLKAEATFSHPSGGRVTIDWTMDRALAAGLLKNPTWKQYPRAMLRSRVVSEGIRTCYPRVIAGAYTPEEAQGIDPEEAIPTTIEGKIASFEKPGLTQSQLDGFLAIIHQAASITDLKSAFAEAWTAAKNVRDDQRMNTLRSAYDARKDELTLDAQDMQRISTESQTTESRDI